MNSFYSFSSRVISLRSRLNFFSRLAIDMIDWNGSALSQNLGSLMSGRQPFFSYLDALKVDF